MDKTKSEIFLDTALRSDSPQKAVITFKAFQKSWRTAAGVCLDFITCSLSL